MSWESNLKQFEGKQTVLEERHDKYLLAEAQRKKNKNKKKRNISRSILFPTIYEDVCVLYSMVLYIISHHIIFMVI